MSYHWINPEDYTMDTFLLFDRWVLRYLLADNPGYHNGAGGYRADLAKALSRYPHVVWFCRRKAPETAGFLDTVLTLAPQSLSEQEARRAESAILACHETFVVYAYPQLMERLNYIRNWQAETLYRLVDLSDKIVLDVGAGTGRLTFAAAKKAKRVYASEPCDTLREHMRDRICREGIPNVKVLDGIVTDLPFEDNTFDAVLSGHVVGDAYDREIAEMTRVVKNGGWIVCCNGEDEYRRAAEDNELTSRGFEFFRHESLEGGVIYNYRRQVLKEKVGSPKEHR